MRNTLDHVLDMLEDQLAEHELQATWNNDPNSPARGLITVHDVMSRALIGAMTVEVGKHSIQFTAQGHTGTTMADPIKAVLAPERLGIAFGYDPPTAVEHIIVWVLDEGRDCTCKWTPIARIDPEGCAFHAMVAEQHGRAEALDVLAPQAWGGV